MPHPFETFLKVSFHAVDYLRTANFAEPQKLHSVEASECGASRPPSQSPGAQTHPHPHHSTAPIDLFSVAIITAFTKGISSCVLRSEEIQWPLTTKNSESNGRGLHSAQPIRRRNYFLPRETLLCGRD